MLKITKVDLEEDDLQAWIATTVSQKTKLNRKTWQVIVGLPFITVVVDGGWSQKHL